MKYQGKIDAVRRVLLDDWDPIGVRGVLHAQDEYDAYLPGIIALLEAQAPVDRVTEHLTEITSHRMGLVDVNDRDRRAAERLVALHLV